MDDLQWLATRQLSWQVDSPPVGGEQVIVAPIHIARAQRAGSALIVSVAGYPTGRHHSLIKAAEARLAVQTGAAEVWVCVDGHNPDLNAHLAELIAIRDACPPPARLGLLTPQALAPSQLDITALAAVAAQAGFDRIIVPPQSSPRTWPLEAVALLRADSAPTSSASAPSASDSLASDSLASTSSAASAAEVIAQLEAGAGFVATARLHG